MVYEHHKLDVQLGQVFDVENGLVVTLKGDNLSTLTMDWYSVLARQGALVWFVASSS